MRLCRTLFPAALGLLHSLPHPLSGQVCSGIDRLRVGIGLEGNGIDAGVRGFDIVLPAQCRWQAAGQIRPEIVVGGPYLAGGVEIDGATRNQVVSQIDDLRA